MIIQQPDIGQVSRKIVSGFQGTKKPRKNRGLSLRSQKARPAEMAEPELEFINLFVDW